MSPENQSKAESLGPTSTPPTSLIPVTIRRAPVTLPTYSPLPPDRNPMFLERRVYQGSSGKVYPLPFYDRISETPHPRQWNAIWIENAFLCVMILPELGGRIHIAQDKSNGYDFIYRQDVIKPALVGLAGPWISGGIEFNWPQHHRPATFMPCDVEIESSPDGSKTVWLGDHEPMSRMKGMHGVCLHPDKALIELRVRLYNRTMLTQSFLWWANVATKVHEQYESFFPTDVHYVADHAKRAMSSFPLCLGTYYGVDYASRAHDGVPNSQTPRQFQPPNTYAANDLSWYANIPVPTSYMCMGSREDFFGGYDHSAHAGIVHVASHHISPGKKQWTWGNHDFGYAWDRNLTDPDSDGVYHPYIELMAGVFTDNQPDFSFLAPGETRTFSQFWYPIQQIGPAHRATTDAAVSLSARDGQLRIGVAVTAKQDGLCIQLNLRNQILASWQRNLSPRNPFVETIQLPDGASPSDLLLIVTAGTGSQLIRYQPKPQTSTEVPPPATEPPAPADISSSDELYLTGLHLEQYRHATRRPESYWLEALRRDPLDSRCNNMMGLWHLRRGEFDLAITHFRRSIQRSTLRNPNPRDGEPYFNLGLALRHLDRPDEACDAFFKSTWNAAWQSPAFHAIAEIDCTRGDWQNALAHLDLSLKTNIDHLKARNLKAIVLRKLGRESQALALLKETFQLDPLDWGTRHVVGEKIYCDTQTKLDLAWDFAQAGLFEDATQLLETATPEPNSGTAPLVGYYLGYLRQKSGQSPEKDFHRASSSPPDYCFPSRLHEINILQAAIKSNPRDPRPKYYLANLFYDRRRFEEAIALWQQSADLDPSFPTVWRNLGIGYFNISHLPEKARQAYDKAIEADPSDARLFYERDQLRKRLGDDPTQRLSALTARLDLVRQRDDLSIELCALYNQTGSHSEALELLQSRRFQPWEGGEGLALGQHVRTHLALGRKKLAANDPRAAVDHFRAALDSPANLSEARHLLANQSDVHYWLGLALHAAGDSPAAASHWTKAATFHGDFQEMAVRTFSEMTFYSALAASRLGQHRQAKSMLTDLREYAQDLFKKPAKIDYFATSLPTMLLFEEDIQSRRQIAAMLMLAEADLGLGDPTAAKSTLKDILERDPSHPLAADLLDDLNGDSDNHPAHLTCFCQPV